MTSARRASRLVAPILLAGVIGGTTLGPAATASAQSQNSTIDYGASGVTATLDCGKGGALQVDGSHDAMTVMGTCSSARISGDANQITFDMITDTIDLRGNDNNVAVKANFAGSTVRVDGNNDTLDTG